MPTKPETNTQAPETTPAAAPVSDKRTAAKGVIPKQMQSWIFLTVILIAAVGLWFSSSAKPRNNPSAGSSAAEQVKPAVGGLSPDEVQRRLQEIETANRLAQKNSVSNQPGQSNNPAGSGSSADATSTGANAPAQSNAPAGDPIAEDERKREYVSRFASNLALSYRSDSRASSSIPSGRLPAAMPTPEEVANTASLPPELPGSPDFAGQIELLQARQARLLAEQQQLSSAAGPQAQQQGQAQAAPTPARKNVDLNAASGKNHVIFEGTAIESVLVNRLNSDFAGPVICQITTDVYSHDRSQLLIPAGSRVLGETKKVSDAGQERLAVVFHRLIMPDGYSVDLDQAPGLNQIGETALHDKVNNHYLKIFGASIAVGAIAGLATIGTNNSAVTGLPTSNASAYREGVAGSLSQSSLHILDKFLNIPPTVTIREGHRVQIFLTQDLLVPAYAQHRMPSDL